MSNIENLTSKIIEDSKREAETMLSKAKKEAEELLNSKIKTAQNVKEDLLQKAVLEAKSKKDRIISGAELKARNEKLKAKQEVIDRVFKDTIAKLSTMNEEEFTNFLKSSISSLELQGGEELLVSKDLKKWINSEVVESLNLKLSKEERDIPSGFIIINNGIELNYTFEALVLSLREDLEYQVASILFN
ncbi:V-type ATP synthase subunit E [Hathewaya massiliensis]|uniref:V-type ATP synthase subunit E n=1 Tax=Hathewaya massiliensis TaxID=1964382 RepID=UPI00115938FD|nr:V-type ATP synthase subunit E family protein [Hathewaya massiliensis]